MHTIDVKGLPTVFLGQDRYGTGIGIFQSGSSTPYVTLRDEDSDGIFDFIEYSVLDSKGAILKSVEDYGFDGQADFIVDYAARSARVFIDGKWYPVDGIGTDQEKTVNVSGKVRPLREIVDELRNDAI